MTQYLVDVTSVSKVKIDGDTIALLTHLSAIFIFTFLISNGNFFFDPRMLNEVEELMSLYI